ncbi:MAG TPA: serine/threonine-protein kinase [Polyangiaceae bacterium]|nr:serine/threonine-protein kinase [Polyangiaceae bacterium]
MSTPPKAGDVVAGKYVLEREIGRGGLGVVVAAQHAVLRQRVALKFLRPEFVREPEAVGRFLREAQAAARMRGEHVARVMDAGILETGEAFLVMEHLEGRDLAAALDAEGPLPVEDAVDYLLQACEAVAEAHALGIVHRDLKPANLFLTRAPDGSAFVKVLDFGLSKLAAAESRDSLTADHQVLGSPHFMSPEQMRSSRNVDARSDVWALGAVLFTLLAGQYPFEGRLLTEICAAILGGELRRLRDLRPDVPESLEAIVARCLRTAPEARYESVAALAAALEPFAPQRARPRAGRVGRVLESARASAPAPVDDLPPGFAPAAPPTPPGLAPVANALLAGVAATSTPPWLADPPSSSSPELSQPSAPPSFGLRAPVRDSAPPSSATSSGQVLLASGLAGQSDRPPWAQSSHEIVAAAPAQPTKARLSLGLTLGALGASGAALAIWGALRAGSAGAPPASPTPQRVVVPLAATAELVVSAGVPPSKSPSDSSAGGQGGPREATSASPGGSLGGLPESPPRSPAQAASATGPAPRPPARSGPPVGPPASPPAGPPASPPGKGPLGPVSDEDLIKRLPH